MIVPLPPPEQVTGMSTLALLKCIFTCGWDPAALNLYPPETQSPGVILMVPSMFPEIWSGVPCLVGLVVTVELAIVVVVVLMEVTVN